jgi:hypothetical protein
MDPDNSNPNPPTDPKPADPVPTPDPAVHEEIGRLKKVSEDFDSYRNQVDPVLQTLYSDPDLFNTVLDKHNKRLGVPTDPTPAPSSDPKPADPAPVVDKDARNYILTQTFRDFESDKGLVDLSNDSRTDLNNRILSELKDMLDPMGNKTINQVLQDVSLTKLPRFLEKAYDLATKDEQRQAARDAGKAEALGESAGIIGSMPSGSVNPDKVTLTLQEKEAARKMRISEEKYLENKKKILERNA